MTLLEQYNNLSDMEKNALMIYKSKLFIFINKLDEILYDKYRYEKYKKFYEEYKGYISDPINSFMRLGVFSLIDFSNYENFLRSIKKVKDILFSIEGKLTIPYDMRVYRMVSSEKDLNVIFKDSLVSTTTDIAVTDNFYVPGKKNSLLSIDIPKGTPCLVVPYSVVVKDTAGKYHLQVSSNDSQKEVILFGPSLNYEIQDKKYFEDEDLTVYKISTKLVKEKTY